MSHSASSRGDLRSIFISFRNYVNDRQAGGCGCRWRTADGGAVKRKLSYTSYMHSYLHAQHAWCTIERLHHASWPGMISRRVSTRGRYSRKNWVGVCGPLPKTLTLFMTKICDFPYPIYALTENLIPFL